MMAAVANGVFPSMDACIERWVVPLLGEAEAPDAALNRTYEKLYGAYRDARHALEPVWAGMADYRQATRRADPGTDAAGEPAEMALGADQ